MRHVLIVFSAIFFLSSGVNADLREICEELLKTPPQFIFPTGDTSLVSENSRDLARRVAEICSSSLNGLIWPEAKDSSEARREWRRLAIYAAELSVNARVLSGANTPNTGLTPEHLQMMTGLFASTESFLGDFFTKRTLLEERKEEDLLAPANQLSDLTIKHLSAPEDAQQRSLSELSRTVMGLASNNLLSPESITKFILAIRMPDEIGSPLKREARARIKAKYPEQCTKLGQSFLRCIDFVTSNSLSGWRYAAAKVAATAFNVFDTSVGAFLLWVIDDALTSESSLAIPIAERLIQTLSEQNSEPITSEESAQLKKKFENLIDQDLGEFIQQLIHEDPNKYRTIKDVVQTTVEQIKHTLVDFVWNREARAAQHFLFYYLPPLFKKSVLGLENTLFKKNTQSAVLAREVGLLSHDVAAAYLWREGESEEQLRKVFIDSIQATSEQVTYLLLSQDGESNPTANAMRSARTLTTLHMFLEDYQTGQYRAQILERDLNRPLMNLIFEVMKHKYPGEDELHGRFDDLIRHGSSAFFNTVLDPRLIVTLIIRFDFPEAGRSRPKVHSMYDEPKADPSAHQPFGQAVVRVLRSFLSLSGQLGVVNKCLVGIANLFHERIGEQILNGESSDSVRLLRQLFFKQGAEHVGQPRLFVDWIDDEEQLKEALQIWIRDKLMQFIKDEVAASAPAGTAWFIGKEVDALIPAIAAQVDRILWDPEKRALRILFFYYLLPVWRDDILQSLRT
jgi:hypothetical protein